MSASPEFYKPAQAPAFSPSCCATQPLVFGAGAGAGAGDDYSSCRTPTGGGISYLREPTTCPPAPRKPPPPMCRKRLFQAAASADQQRQPCESPNGAPLISLRLDELERLFRPHPPPPTTTAAADKRRRSGSGSGSVSRSGKKHGHHLDTELRSLN